MRKYSKQIISLALILISLLMHGQGLPSLGIAKEIAKGSLPNGVIYYLVTNTEEKALADFALIQKEAAEVPASRLLLEKLPHFGESRPYRFLASNGSAYRNNGYVSYLEDATIYSFPNVPSGDETVSDSTLLMMFDIASRSRRPQAIVVSGDINASKIKERMNLLSMIVPRLESIRDIDNYQWRPKETPSMLLAKNNCSDLAAINVIYNAQRLDTELMNTPQPLVSRSFANNLAYILKLRINSAFIDKCIPLADFASHYLDSSQSAGDEFYSLTVYTSSAYLKAATQELASVLAGLDVSGVSLSELTEAKAVLRTERLASSTPAKMTNAAYVDKCVASYLYGSNLASAQMESSYFDGRNLPDETELQLFNSFVKALLDSERNISLRYDLPKLNVDKESILKLFCDKWTEVTETPLLAVDRPELSADSLIKANPKTIVRLRSESKEPVSGGKLWTFSNGIKVVYKNVPMNGGFRYALMLRGGFASVEGLQSGESAFVSDMLRLSSVAGMSGDDFHKLLKINGITMEEDSDLSCLRLSGYSDNSQLTLLMRALLSISQKRKLDTEAFERYKRNEALRLDKAKLYPRDINSLMDSIIRPDYFYTERRFIANLNDDLPTRTEQYFAANFDKINDGVFVFVGDIDEDILKKELCRTLGSFSTQKKISPRPRVSNRFASGAVTFTDFSAPGTVGGKERGVNFALSAMLPYNVETNMSFAVACEALKTELAVALSQYGAYADLSSRIELFPSERLILFINCHPCHQDGLPSEVSPASPVELLRIVRGAINASSGIQISNSELKRYKEIVLNRCNKQVSQAESIVENVLTRYCEGKDLVSDYKNAINSVSVESVQKVLSAILEGSEVEYVII